MILPILLSMTLQSVEIGIIDLKQKNEDDGDDKKRSASSPPKRAPPRHAVSINNLSDRQYCCVWSVEVYEDGYVSC